MRDPKERLRDILDALNHIDRYTSRGREAFEREELILWHRQWEPIQTPHRRR